MGGTIWSMEGDPPLEPEDPVVFAPLGDEVKAEEAARNEGRRMDDRKFEEEDLRRDFSVFTCPLQRPYVEWWPGQMNSWKHRHLILQAKAKVVFFIFAPTQERI